MPRTLEQNNRAAPAAIPPRPRESVATVVAEAEKEEHEKVFAKGHARYRAPKAGEILTVAGLREVFALLSAEDAQRYHPRLVEALREAEVNTPWRMAHFLGQVGHESGSRVGGKSSPTARPTKGARIWATSSPVTDRGTRGGARSCSREGPTTVRREGRWAWTWRGTPTSPRSRGWGSESRCGSGAVGG